jgi:hypothetical protein
MEIINLTSGINVATQLTYNECEAGGLIRTYVLPAGVGPTDLKLPLPPLGDGGSDYLLTSNNIHIVVINKSASLMYTVGPNLGVHSPIAGVSAVDYLWSNVVNGWIGFATNPFLQ